MRRRFWRASGLLSTSGGRLFATELGECTKKARVACGLMQVRLAAPSPDAGDEEGGSEELDMLGGGSDSSSMQE